VAHIAKQANIPTGPFNRPGPKASTPLLDLLTPGFSRAGVRGAARPFHLSLSAPPPWESGTQEGALAARRISFALLPTRLALPSPPATVSSPRLVRVPLGFTPSLSSSDSWLSRSAWSPCPSTAPRNSTAPRDAGRHSFLSPMCATRVTANASVCVAGNAESTADKFYFFQTYSFTRFDMILYCCDRIAPSLASSAAHTLVVLIFATICKNFTAWNT
jgi:hypothetical protein